MGWFLQTPDGRSPKLLQKITDLCGTAEKGGGAFAFASSQGIKMLAAEPVFSKFLKACEFTMIVGLDAITDTRAVDELRKLSKSHPNLKPKLFVHSTGGALFHPKTLWLRTAEGGVIITGSGNLTSGGLKSNWEAMAIETLSDADMMIAEKSWDEWIKAHAKQLLDLDDPKAIEKAQANRISRSKIEIALKKTKSGDEEVADEDVDLVEEVFEEVENELLLNRVLIAEVPRSGSRWQQVNFDLKSYQEFFGVKKDATRHVRFYEVKLDGTLSAPEDRQSVSVVSENFRFEVGAALGKPYPANGHPICIFEQTDEDTFRYVLLLPDEDGHKRIQDYLNSTYKRTSNRKLRVQMTAGTLKSVWPDAHFFR